jgi:hypothetical protein
MLMGNALFIPSYLPAQGCQTLRTATTSNSLRSGGSDGSCPLRPILLAYFNKNSATGRFAELKRRFRQTLPIKQPVAIISFFPR